jgi:hypothetical protein
MSGHPVTEAPFPPGNMTPSTLENISFSLDNTLEEGSP